MTDEPPAPPNDNDLTAMLELRINKVWLGQRYTTAGEGFVESLRRNQREVVSKWIDELNLTDEQMKVLGYDTGSKSVGAIYVATWTPDGLRYTEIPTEDFYMPDPHGGNIGGNASEDT